MPQNRVVCSRPGHDARTQTAANNLQPWKARRTIAVLTLRSQRSARRPTGGIPLTRRACLCQACALPRAWPAPGAAAARPKLRRIAPRRTALAPCTGPGAPGANPAHDPHRLSPLIACPLAESGRPDTLRRRQESPAKRRHEPHQCKCPRSGEGMSFLVRGAPSPSQCAVSADYASSPARRRSQLRPVDRHNVLLRCCILVLYNALELWAQDFEFISLTWVELRGFEPRTSCMPSAGSTSTAVRLSPQVTVPERAHQSVQIRTGCCTFPLYRSALSARHLMSA